MDRAEIHHWNGRHWLASAGLCVAQATLSTAPATAAQNDQPEAVVVTGSSIRQNPVELVAPLQMVSAADADIRGELSVADYLQRLPISGSAPCLSCDLDSYDRTLDPVPCRFFHARAALEL